jgi:hypothetical protein
MTEIIDLNEGRLLIAAKKGYRNWARQFKEEFGIGTRLSHISLEAVSFLAQGKDKGTFYLYDLIMNLDGLGSGFEFNELSPKKKMVVIDKYLFLLDHIRFECMKRLGWIEGYPGEEYTLVELINRFDKLAPSLQANVPVLSRNHPDYERYSTMNTFDKESLIRKLIPKAVSEIQGQSTTL